jgi:hypothetical protein
MESILITVVSGLLTLAGVCVTAWASAKKTRDEVANRLYLNQAITDTKLDELTREVRAHNNFARRMPVVEEQIKVINHRLSDLEEAK